MQPIHCEEYTEEHNTQLVAPIGINESVVQAVQVVKLQVTHNDPNKDWQATQAIPLETYPVRHVEQAVDMQVRQLTS